MTLFNYFLNYMTELCEGERTAPDGITLTAATPEARAEELQGQIAMLGIEQFVRLCAAQDGTELPSELFDAPSDAPAAEEAPLAQVPDDPPKSNEPDPDAGKHAFEVFADCLALDEELISYLIEVLKTNDRTAFYKLSQVSTHLDLDPEEFLYWLAHREDYASEEERACAVIMDACFERLRDEHRMDVVAALLSGDRPTFDIFRCEAPELRQLPVATFQWFAQNYLDRDYPLRFILKHNGVVFPETLKKEATAQ